MIIKWRAAVAASDAKAAAEISDVPQRTAAAERPRIPSIISDQVAIWIAKRLRSPASAWWRCDLSRQAAVTGRPAALDAIHAHVGRGDLSDGLIFDAVRVRLIEIGEAVKALPSELLKSEPDLPWAEIARMRDQLAHRYFDTTHAIVSSTVVHDLPDLRQAIARLLGIAGED